MQRPANSVNILTARADNSGASMRGTSAGLHLRRTSGQRWSIPMPVRFEKAHCFFFLEQAGVRQLVQMFDLLPDTLFWIKDTQSRFIHVNQCCFDRIGLEALTLDQAIGLTDYDFFPKRVAEQFAADDRRVLEGHPLNERLEVNILRSGEICWFMTCKRPLYDNDGRILGSYGVSHNLDRTSFSLKALDQLRASIDFIRKHYARPISIAELAAASCLSVSALERRFHKYLAKTPKQFINEVRLESARRLLLDSTLPISAIAHQVGFTDPGYFTRQFLRYFGERPSDCRENAQTKALSRDRPEAAHRSRRHDNK